MIRSFGKSRPRPVNRIVAFSHVSPIMRVGGSSRESATAFPPTHRTTSSGFVAAAERDKSSGDNAFGRRRQSVVADQQLRTGIARGLG